MTCVGMRGADRRPSIHRHAEHGPARSRRGAVHERVRDNPTLLTQPGDVSYRPVHPHINGIVDNTARPSHQLPVFPLALQRAGYRTGFFGKWHMGNDDSPRPGFDHWVAMPGQGDAIDPSLNVDGQRVHANGYTTDLLTDYVERFIDRPSDRPFLLVALTRPSIRM